MMGTEHGDFGELLHSCTAEADAALVAPPLAGLSAPGATETTPHPQIGLHVGVILHETHSKLILVKKRCVTA